jgi:hypothetical protein
MYKPRLNYDAESSIYEHDSENETTNDHAPTKPIIYYEHPFTTWYNLYMDNLDRQFTARRTVLFIFVTMWTLFSWGILYAKMTGEGISVRETFGYFTNVVFFMQALFFSCYLLSFFGDVETRTLEFVVLGGFMLMVVTQIMLVAIFVMVVLYDSPTLITSPMISGGGDFDDGLVLAMDRIFHVLPAFVAIIFLFAARSDYTECCIYLFGHVFVTADQSSRYNCWSNKSEVRATYKSEDVGEYLENPLIPGSRVFIPPSYQLTYALSQVFLGLLPFFVYAMVIDVKQQYGMDARLTEWVLVIAVLALVSIVVMIPLYFVFNVAIPARNIPPEIVQKMSETCFGQDETSGYLCVVRYDVPDSSPVHRNSRSEKLYYILPAPILTPT